MRPRCRNVDHKWKIILGFRVFGDRLQYDYIKKCRRCGRMESIKWKDFHNGAL